MRFPFGQDYKRGENLMVKKTEKLYMELSALENRGVTIWLEELQAIPSMYQINYPFTKIPLT